MDRICFIAIVILISVASFTHAANDALPEAQLDDPQAVLDADLEAMQGLWVREYKNPAGALYRVEKLVEGDRDTVTHVDQNGNVIHAHQSDFKLERSGRVRIYTFSNSTAIAGPNIGGQRAGPESYVYRLQGKTMFEVWGLLEGDRRPLGVLVWKKEQGKPK